MKGAPNFGAAELVGGHTMPLEITGPRFGSLNEKTPIFCGTKGVPEHSKRIVRWGRVTGMLRDAGGLKLIYPEGEEAEPVFSQAQLTLYKDAMERIRRRTTGFEQH